MSTVPDTVPTSAPTPSGIPLGAQIPVPGWVTTLTDRFRDALLPSNPGSAKAYAKTARQFLAWCSAVYGIDSTAAIPTDAVPRFYADRAWAQATRNMANAGILAFERWARASGEPIPTLDYPPTVNVERKRGRDRITNTPRKAPGFVQDRTEDSDMPETATLVATRSLDEAGPLPGDFAGSVPDPVPSTVRPTTQRPGGNGNGSGQRLSTAPSTAPSADQDTHAGTVSDHGAVGQAGAPPRPAGKRHAMTRDPVADMMPTAGGFLRISIRGTDGKPSLINDYTAADMVGFSDVVSFINKVLRPTYGPFTGDRDATYVVNRHDFQGNSVAVVHIPIAAPKGGSNGALSMNGMGGSGDKASLLERKLIDSFEQQQKETDAKFAKVIEVIKTVAPMGGAGGPVPSVNLAEIITSLKEVMKPDTSAMQAILAEIREDKRSARRRDRDDDGFEERSARPIAPAANPLAGFDGPLDPPKPTAQDEMIKMLLERALPANGGNVSAPPTNPLNDAIDLIVKLKTVFAPPSPSAEMVELRTQVQRLTDKLDDTMNKGGPIQAKIAELKAMRELAEIFNSEGEKPSFMDYIPDITKGISDVAKAFAGRTPTVTTPRPGGNVARPAEPAPSAAKPAEPMKIPVPAQHAILALRDAKPDAEDFDQQIVNSLFSLISTLHGAGDPWKTKAGGILNRLKAANSYPEIQALLTDTLLACGAQKVINSSPGMIERCAVAIWRHYHEIHAAVWSEPRFLSDNPAGSYVTPEGQKANAPKKPKEAAPGGKDKTPAPAGEEEEEEEEEEGEEADGCEVGHEGDHDFDGDEESEDT